MPELEIASKGSIELSRVLPYSTTELDFRVSQLKWDQENWHIDNSQAIYGTNLESEKYKKEMASTEPLIIPAEMIVVRGIQSEHFRIREKQEREQYYEYIRPENPVNNARLTRKRKHYHMVANGYSNEFALSRFKKDDLIQALTESNGFYWNKERLFLLGAVLKNQISIEGVEGNLLRPRMRPFRVTPHNISTNGDRYIPKNSNRILRKSNLIWQAIYSQQD